MREQKQNQKNQQDEKRFGRFSGSIRSGFYPRNQENDPSH